MRIRDQQPDYYFASYFGQWCLTHFFHKKRIDKIIPLIPGGSFVLDAGCGSGLVPFLLATKKDCTGVGVDIRKECVEFASRRVPSFEFYQNDIKSLSLPHRFDVVICLEVLEHFDPVSQAKIIDCLDYHLKDGGLLVLTFPSKFYFAIEPVWKLIRKLLHPLIVFDDEEYHRSIPQGKLVSILRHRSYTVEQSGAYTFGLISYTVARKNVSVINNLRRSF